MCGLKKAEFAAVSNHRSLYLHLRLLLSHGRADQVCPRVTINKLPDEVLLEIFELCMVYPLSRPSRKEDAWHTLVHVCRRWRHVVFGSPCRLDLRLLCVNSRLTKTLDMWPELPIVIHVDDEKFCRPPGVGDVISMLKRHDRVCQISIDSAPNSLLKEVATMSASFPALVELKLASFEDDPLVLPDSFLSGAPHLQSLNLWGIPFPGIGKLPLSTHNLVFLSLGFLPPSRDFSPDAMVDILSALTKLKTLHLNFDHSEIPQISAHRASQRTPVPTRVALPTLTTFAFYGDSDYLENMVSCIDAPLDRIFVTFSNQLVFFDMPLLRDFICRTGIFYTPNRLDTFLSYIDARIALSHQNRDNNLEVFNLEIPYPSGAVELQLSSLAQACSKFLPPLPSLEHLAIYNSKLFPFRWRHGVNNNQWMELLRPFTTVKDLILDELVVFSVAQALQELVGEQVTEILPVLQNIFLEGTPSSDLVPEGIAKFVGARELSGHPVIVHHREGKY